MFGFHDTHYNMDMRQIDFLLQQLKQNWRSLRRGAIYCALTGIVYYVRRSMIYHAPTALLLVLLVGCTLESTPVPTPDLPRVQFIAPPNNSRVVNNTDLTIDLFAHDSTIGIAKIELYADGALVKEASLPNYAVQTDFRVQVNWLASGLGFHVLSAIAYRPDGTRSDETFLSIEVVDG